MHENNAWSDLKSMILPPDRLLLRKLIVQSKSSMFGGNSGLKLRQESHLTQIGTFDSRLIISYSMNVIQCAYSQHKVGQL
jgi:hypothetical protein